MRSTRARHLEAPANWCQASRGWNEGERTVRQSRVTGQGNNSIGLLNTRNNASRTIPVLFSHSEIEGEDAIVDDAELDTEVRFSTITGDVDTTVACGAVLSAGSFYPDTCP